MFQFLFYIFKEARPDSTAHELYILFTNRTLLSEKDDSPLNLYRTKVTYAVTQVKV
jgi:hypothetical protein